MVENTPTPQATAPPTPERLIYFPGMDPGEKFRFYFRKHWIHPARAFVQLILWMLALAAIAYLSGVRSMEDPYTRRLTVVLLCAFFLISHFHFIMKIYRHFLCVSIVTNNKVHYFKRTLLAVDKHESVALRVLQDINKSQSGLIQNLFGFGSLNLEAQNSKMRIHFVPHIDDVYDVIVKEVAEKRGIPAEAKEQLHEAVEETVDEVAEQTS